MLYLFSPAPVVQHHRCRNMVVCFTFRSPQSAFQFLAFVLVVTTSFFSVYMELSWFILPSSRVFAICRKRFVTSLLCVGAELFISELFISCAVYMLVSHLLPPVVVWVATWWLLKIFLIFYQVRYGEEEKKWGGGHFWTMCLMRSFCKTGMYTSVALMDWENLVFPALFLDTVLKYA